ncbi:MAG: general secretion pathway protein GspB [Desulfotignum sp.]|nr:general secretion pathway protein GspB [Desulfotignum sp.]
MSRREKILLAVTLLVALYGVLSLMVFSSGNKGGNKPVPATGADQRASSREVSRLMAKIQDLEIELPRKKSLIQKIDSPWAADPFVTPGQEKTQPQAAQMADALSIETELTYSGYIFAGKRAMAMINGTEYSIGDTVLETGYRVVRITPVKVIVKKNQNTAEIFFNGE